MTKVNFIPLRDYLLVEPIEVPYRTPSGIVLPESFRDRPNQGKVIKTGDGQLNDRGEVIPMTVHANDTVLFPKYTGTEIKLDGKKYLIMREMDIFGVLEQE